VISKTRNNLTSALSALVPMLCVPMLAMAHTPAALPQSPTHWIVLGSVVLGCLFVLGIIAISLSFAHKQDRERLHTIARMVEKGQQVPRALLAPHEVAPEIRRRIDLQHAILLLCLGLGGGLTLWLVTYQWRMAAWSLIFLFLSAGKFINWHLAGRPDASRTQDHAPGA
jgi:hypothetical protein